MTHDGLALDRGSRVFDWIDRHARDRASAGLTRIVRPRSSDATVLDLAGNDYLGLAREPEVIRAAVEAARTWGAGSTGSRLVTGTTELHVELERELAAFVGAESALVFSSGYAANLAVVTALTGPDTLIVSDRNNHASLVDACRLSRARVEITAHGDVAAVDRALATHTGGPAVVLTESVYSVDGDAAPLRALHDSCRARGAALIVDDAHGLGVVGPAGAGGFAAAGISGDPDAVATVTLSKALGSQGGAVIGPQRVIEHLTQTARTFVFDTGLAPASTAAALRALRLIRREPQRSDRVRRVAEQLHAGLRASGVGVGKPGAAVLGIPAGTPAAAATWADVCREHGLRVGCFRPPSVPDSASRLRLTARADLTRHQIVEAVRVLTATAPTTSE